MRARYANWLSVTRRHTSLDVLIFHLRAILVALEARRAESGRADRAISGDAVHHFYVPHIFGASSLEGQYVDEFRLPFHPIISKHSAGGRRFKGLCNNEAEPFAPHQTLTPGQMNRIRPGIGKQLQELDLVDGTF